MVARRVKTISQWQSGGSMVTLINGLPPWCLVRLTAWGSQDYLWRLEALDKMAKCRSQWLPSIWHISVSPYFFLFYEIRTLSSYSVLQRSEQSLGALVKDRQLYKVNSVDRAHAETKHQWKCFVGRIIMEVKRNRLSDDLHDHQNGSVRIKEPTPQLL